jgi:hypothetical protein
MAEETSELESQFEEIKIAAGEAQDVMIADVSLAQSLYYILLLWVDFHLYISSPYISPQQVPTVIKPGMKSDQDETECVYTIYDYGDHFSTSVGDRLAMGTRSTARMFNTVIKMMDLVVKRVKEVDSNAGSAEAGEEQAVRVALDGHEIPQRMAFKQCVMHELNILVTNFDPGVWGERQLRVMEHLASRGFLPGMGKS